ncbi:DNA polymerase III subunit gamma/tau [Inediibacterium massiliense]|uniref:DNA polymerase III subunit gamma/tau n=1 Tax=Inediibacterium massiliense TaxID=1658111 RepID=UPI0006B43D9E|nr:DNA polymerase III subunit gamma/tau [Inediibacterium massiliense]
MAYMALYRKWRPQVFEDVVGQEHITKTLKNQIRNNNIAHAYLFCGTRGTGKTSTAKIFARAVNCLQPKEYNPCNTCENCSGILHENIMDVIEIDAASNNGVDDIRELRENVQYPPTNGKYKVYIIDEVHMLSTGAFNALLKTLEEPPSYALFILATTEPHKIPATILSRCQRFDFKRVTETDLIDRMNHICTHMGIEVEEEALHLIARNSDGAMRDALSILDQCISFENGKITYEHVIDLLGTVSDEYLFKIVEAIANRETQNLIEQIEEIVSLGKDIQQFIKDLLQHYRNLMMTKVSNAPDRIIHMSKENIQRLREQENKISMNEIIRAIQELSSTLAEVKWTTQPRVFLEISMIKLSKPQMDVSIEGLVERIAQLEKVIQSGKIHIETQEEKSKDLDEKKEEKHKNPSVKRIPLESLKKGWSQILQVIKKRKISIYAVLMEGELVEVSGNQLIVSFKQGYGFHKEAAEKSPYKEFIEDVVTEMVGQKLHLKCVMEDELHTMPKGEQSKEDEEVQKIIELFGENQVEIIE